MSQEKINNIQKTKFRYLSHIKVSEMANSKSENNLVKDRSQHWHVERFIFFRYLQTIHLIPNGVKIKYVGQKIFWCVKHLLCVIIKYGKTFVKLETKYLIGIRVKFFSACLKTEQRALDKYSNYNVA